MLTLALFLMSLVTFSEVPLARFLRGRGVLAGVVGCASGWWGLRFLWEVEGGGPGPFPSPRGEG